MSQINISDFLNEKYSQSALYDSYRSIGSYIDGLKSSSRKVLHVVKKNDIKTNVKVSRLASDVASETEYLHGTVSLEGVISGMAQDFVGSNNMNYLYPAGSFGNRHTPEAGASRYIYTRKHDNLEKMFLKEDDALLIEQEFEGTKIEPRYFVPVLPNLFINGSEGIGTGFSQKILPRNPKELIKWLEQTLAGKKPTCDLTPWYKGFTGDIYKEEEDRSWTIEGKISKVDQTTLEITEIPVGISLSQYNKILVKLEEDKVIKDFEDLSENDQFLFRIKATRELCDKDNDKLLDIFKLRKKVAETLVCIDENNAIREFESVEEILEAYLKIRQKYYVKRKSHLIKQFERDIAILNSKYLFIKAVIEKEIEVNNKKKSEIEAQIKLIKEIVTVDDKYDYLLSMPIYSLTKERYNKIKEEIEAKGQELELLSKKTEADLWKEDLKKINF